MMFQQSAQRIIRWVAVPTKAWCDAFLRLRRVAISLLLVAFFLVANVFSQDAQPGVVVNVGLPIDDAAQRQVESAINTLRLAATPQTGRQTIVLQFGNPGDPASGADTAFERGLQLARFLTSESATDVKTVAYVAGDVQGHAVLPVLACDQIVVAPGARLGAAGIDQAAVDPVVQLAYESIAERRRTIPIGAVRAMLNADLELARISQVDGGDLFLSGAELTALRDQGKVWKEEQLAPQGELANFVGSQMRTYRWATHEVRDLDELATALGLSQLIEPQSLSTEKSHAVLAEINGPINRRRMRRVHNNLADAIARHDLNYVLLHLNSPGGDLNESLQLGATIASFPRQGIRTAAFVDTQAIGDAALVVLAAQQVYMSPDAFLGGPGAASIDAAALDDLGEAIDQIARSTGRSPALLRGLLDRDLNVFEYRDARSGRVAYFSTAEHAARDDAPRWTRQGEVSLADGIAAEQALQLGLISGIESDLSNVCQTVGLDEIPQRLDERRIVNFVENLGRQVWLPRVLLFVGFFMLSVEMGAPGIGFPGFLALVSLMLFFWIQAAGGTAEWLEIFLFVGGVVCLAAEVLLFPGFGVFGVGGLVMLVASLILVSQTFVVPNNAYQYNQLTGNLIGVLAAIGGMLGGGLALRWMLPQLPFFRHLMMVEDEEEKQIRAENEAIVHWDHLQGQRGITTTPLVPSGKARFGEEWIAVVSDGPMIDAQRPVIVKQVYGNRVVVEELFDEGAGP
ncbi:hypothetical protein Poly24_19060 [Rosistilla carotiformis]|uniref:Uncharacterized protein n=1 Tax=Rosistilla carotiformis TaxID=2528017 RepID=A0A518JRN9_9BACT|nr:NfeD family protein [Rosistilla carotiformis]QDV68197.1 hypothetical protein Poly24_19060 [Rosistilla carotiformis]